MVENRRSSTLEEEVHMNSFWLGMVENRRSSTLPEQKQP